MIFALIGACILTCILCVAIINARALPYLGPTAHADELPRVSVMIPARNEAAVIGDLIRSLVAQEPAVHEVLVLDDASVDGTATRALEAADGDARVRVLPGQPLPPGWCGKNWACHQLAQQATGEVFLFTDADVQWRPGALGSVVETASRSGADLLTVWPTQTTKSWGERLVVPLMAFAVLGYLPIWLVHRVPHPSAAAANGQCLLFRREAYQAIGGHAGVSADVVEDVQLARQVKRAGLALRMADGNGLVRCRMYEDWPGVRDGFAKNLLAGHGNSITLLALSTLFHLVVFVSPWVWLLVAPGTAGWPGLPLLLIALGIASRAVTAVATRQRARDAWLMPVSVLLMTRIALQSVWWHLRYGGPRWKGRTLPVSGRAHSTTWSI